MRELLHSRSHGKQQQQQQQRGDSGSHATTKAAAWAVFQHHGGGALHRAHGGFASRRRASRFKIEAQMRHEIGHRSVEEADGAAPSWDAGSTLFDSFELDSLLKQLDHAFHPADQPEQTSSSDADPGNHHPHPSHHSYGGHDPTHEEDGILPFRGGGGDPGLDSVDETLPLTYVHGGRKHAGAHIAYKDAPVRLMARNLLYAEELHNVDVGPVHASQGSKSHNVFHFLHTPHPWNLLKIGKRRSFDTSSSHDGAGASSAKNANHPRRRIWNIFRHSGHHDGTSATTSMFHHGHARIAPHDSAHQKGCHRAWGHDRDDDHGGRHDQTHHRAWPKSSTAATWDLHHVAQDVPAPCDKHDHQQEHNLLVPQSLKSGLRMVLSRPAWCRSLHLSGDDTDDSDLDTPDACNCHKHSRGGHKPVPPHNARLPRPDALAAAHSHGEHEPGTAFHPSHGNGYHLNHGHGHHGHDGQHGRDGNHGHHGHVGHVGHVHENHYDHHHHHHHHHHHQQQQGEGEDNEMTVQAIVRRVPRKSSEERAHRLSIEDNGLRVPRNSLEIFEDRVRRTSFEVDPRMGTG